MKYFLNRYLWKIKHILAAFKHRLLSNLLRFGSLAPPSSGWQRVKDIKQQGLCNKGGVNDIEEVQRKGMINSNMHEHVRYNQKGWGEDKD